MQSGLNCTIERHGDDGGSAYPLHDSGRFGPGIAPRSVMSEVVLPVRGRTRAETRKDVYGCLPVAANNARALVLSAALSDVEPISCTLGILDLEATPLPVFWALSYVWGDAAVTEDIFVDGVAFAVTINLAAALRHIRRSFGKVTIWADAVCINQDDIPERNQQVLLMKTIYSTAERVVAWIGPDVDESAALLETLDSLCKALVAYPNNMEWVQQLPRLLTVNGTFTGESGKHFESNDRLEKLFRFLNGPFWRRTWIVQELVLPRHLRMMCGSAVMDIPEPSAFYEAIVRTPNLTTARRPASFNLHMLARLRECCSRLQMIATLRRRHLLVDQKPGPQWKGYYGFLRLRINLEMYQATDPRDHVYGLLGIMNLNIAPDYSPTHSAEDVYLEVAQLGLQSEPFDVLNMAGSRPTHGMQKSSSHFELPSWVPDLRLPYPARMRHWRYPQSRVWPAEGGCQMRLVSHKWIRGPGVMWDSISRLEIKTGTDLTPWDLVKDININNPGEVAYPSGILRFKAFVVLWMGGLDETGTSPLNLKLSSKLFRSYELMFLWAIQQPWTQKHGAGGLMRLYRTGFGMQGASGGLVPTDHQEKYRLRATQVRHGMQCFHTEKGYIGFAPLTAEVGDSICVLKGRKAPTLLRRQGSYYELVGDCDVVGIMNGEVLKAVDRGEANVEEIEIR